MEASSPSAAFDTGEIGMARVLPLSLSVSLPFSLSHCLSLSLSLSLQQNEASRKLAQRGDEIKKEGNKTSVNPISLGFSGVRLRFRFLLFLLCSFVSRVLSCAGRHQKCIFLGVYAVQLHGGYVCIQPELKEHLVIT